MDRITKFLATCLNFFMGGFLFLMGAFVFGNVILRYFFNSGLPWAEELSRFLFVWVVFIGAIQALKDNKHLGFTSLIKKMPLSIKKLFYVASNILILGVLYLLFTGSWAMTKLGMLNRASATDIPMAFMFGVGLITFSCMAVIVIINTFKALFVQGAIDGLIELQESEDEIRMAEMSDMTKGDEKV